MSATVRMSASMPAEDRNGLAELVDDLIANPEDTYIAVVVIEARSMAVDLKNGTSVPTVALTAIEPILDVADAAEAQRLLRRGHGRRTGQTEIPLELERELSSIADVRGALTIGTGPAAAEEEPANEVEDLAEDPRLVDDDDTFGGYGPGFSDS